MNPVREYVRERVTRRRSAWSGFLALNYELVLRDRIGRVSEAASDGVPGIWGHSYVRTYYGWMKQRAPEAARLEGGIATTYYVVRSLLELWHRSGAPVPGDLLGEICAFFASRVEQDGGCGIYTVSHRGVPGVEVHLRHTCFAYLTLAELSRAATLPRAAREKLEATAEFIQKVRDPDALWRDWIEESWPIGALASYIAARDALYADGMWTGRESRLWPGVRLRMLESLSEAHSLDIRVSHRRLTGTAQGGTEWWPYWEPIANAEFLRLHSTLGCLHLVGAELLETPRGADRIRTLVAQVRREADSLATGPRFAQIHDPSLAAACALLQLLLGAWYSPVREDIPVVESVMSFIEENWDNPAVYHDFWTEFSAPLFTLDEMAPAMDAGLWNIEVADPVGRPEQDQDDRTREFARIRESVAAVALGPNSRYA